MQASQAKIACKTISNLGSELIIDVEKAAFIESNLGR
jgi:hypothetical protein